jgi:hypothetical protein
MKLIEGGGVTITLVGVNALDRIGLKLLGRLGGGLFVGEKGEKLGGR